MISEQEKADQLYTRYTKLSGEEQGKKEAIKVAEQICALAPIGQGINMPGYAYWQKVVNILKNK
jgi:hypothetical protein